MAVSKKAAPKKAVGEVKLTPDEWVVATVSEVVRDFRQAFRGISTMVKVLVVLCIFVLGFAIAQEFQVQHLQDQVTKRDQRLAEFAGLIKAVKRVTDRVEAQQKTNDAQLGGDTSAAFIEAARKIDRICARVNCGSTPTTTTTTAPRAAPRRSTTPTSGRTTTTTSSTTTTTSPSATICDLQNPLTGSCLRGHRAR